MPQPIYIVASGDLRLSANQECWPAQERAEKAVMAAIGREGRGAARPPVRSRKKHGFIDSQKHGMEVFRRHPARRAAGRRRGGLAVQPPRPARALHATRADPDRRQLERRVARAGRHAQPERLADQGRRRVQHALERGLHRRVLPRRACASGSTTATRHARHQPRPSAVSDLQAARDAERSSARALAAQLRRDKAIMGVFDEGCMGMYNAIIPDELLHPHRHLQGAAEPVARCTPRCSGSPDDEAQAVRAWLDARHAVPHRPEPGHRADRRPDPRASARCTSRRCASPTSSAATPSASSTSRA